jgi:hypothetical protein
VPRAGIGSPKTASPCRRSARTSGSLPRHRPSERAASSRRIATRVPARATAPADRAPDLGLDLRRILLGDHPTVELEHHPPGHDVRVGAALDASDVQVRMGDAGHGRSGRAVASFARTARRGSRSRPCSASTPVCRDRRVRHAAVHGDLDLEAAVVRAMTSYEKPAAEQKSGFVGRAPAAGRARSSPPNSSS